MSLINVSNLNFAYEGSYDNIFEDASFNIDTNWRLGFIGRNGRGKTTFLKLLMGMYNYNGKISSSVNFKYFPFSIQDEFENTINIIESIAPNCEFWMIKRELSLLGVLDDVYYRSFNSLSGGEQAKVMLAALFLNDNCFLLIDEPTNHLDLSGREIVSNYLRSKKGFILVSHDRVFLDNCVDHILSINKTNIEVQSGNFSSWYKNKQMQDDFEVATNEKLKKDINRLEKSAKETSSWSEKVEKTKHGTKNSGLKPDRGFIGHKSAKMMKRSKSIEMRKNFAVEEKSKLLHNIETNEELKIFYLNHPLNKLVSFSDVSLYYNNKSVFKDISFDVNNGDRIALCGKNGCGKSSVLKLILDEKINFEGEFKKASNLKISYVSQDTSFLKGRLNDFAHENNIDESLFKAILRKLDFSRIQFEKDMSNFSGGQKKKVLIAKSLCENAHLYIWDEPLNFIDVFSRIQIEELLLKFRPTILFVEHDEAFVNDVATKVVNFS